MRRQSLDEFREGATEFDRAAALTLGTEETEWQPLPAAPAPRTAAPDTDPPPLAVTAPGFGSVVVEGTVSFSGTTEPGAFVAAGDTAADVDQHGHWLAQLALDPGDNVVTITAVDAAGNVTATKHEVRHEWVIRSDGIGPATGGDPPDQVVAQFVALFGPPTSDDMTEPTGLPFGYGAVSYARFTSWDAAGLFLAFTDGDYFRNDAKPGLISWGTTNPVFVTPEGIHVGSTMESLTAAYGSRLTVSTTDECGPPGEFYIDYPGPEEPWVGFLQGHLSGPPFGPDSVVESLGGGFPSTC
jgi:hypothetical protein